MDHANQRSSGVSEHRNRHPISASDPVTPRPKIRMESNINFNEDGKAMERQIFWTFNYAPTLFRLIFLPSPYEKSLNPSLSR